ncbi:MAG: N-acetyl-gamma-glutamyl-phosphate reductase [Oscillospiraceae bacterium]|jgi:N-acetyl-gamma-glutamyl-phosphate reductase|nr:N-acetyl-gamma-glutamyl-phosphate reductase [Oscillospiraceae bacterium]
MKKAFIDGQAGTTGLKLRSRLERRGDIQLLAIDPDRRKDPAARAALMNQADAVFLCLPDEAAVEAVKLVENPATLVIDASSAHRVNPGWVYGFPELNPLRRGLIASSRRVAVPGCYATGFIALVAPLVQGGWIAPSTPLCCHGISGYSGGGNRMIAEYESAPRPAALDSPRQYGLGQSHKHLREMTAIPGLDIPPVFNPIVCDFFAGMLVSAPLHASSLAKPIGIDGLSLIYSRHYAGERFIRVMPPPPDGFIPSNALAGTNDLIITVSGNDERITLTAAFDNLGKGASGAAMQCMNIALGLDESAGF